MLVYRRGQPLSTLLAYTPPSMVPLLAAFAASLLITFWIVRSRAGRAGAAQDLDLTGPQKFHTRPVPRIGGVGIFAGMLFGLGVAALSGGGGMAEAAWLWACGLFAFGAGLAEDLTKRVRPAVRLAFTGLSAVAAIMVLDAVIDRIPIPGLDWLVSLPAGAVCITVFAVAGVANSVNIIDGFNGLASMCAAIMLASFGYVAFQVGDTLVLTMALVGIGAILGFFFWNFPHGLVFLGDGGAYFVGFWVAETAILLVHRNQQVSPLFPLLACIYPIFETLFSVYRRVVVRERPAGMPDGIHLHSLLYRRIMRWAVGRRGRRSVERRNSMTSPYLWMLCMMAVVPAMLFWQHTALLAVCIAVFGLTYVLLYRAIVRFRTPRFLSRRR
jgi:UDP-N-acetylmuramyl pentapeptide phosphotransferase/UDP-N-acetylglucosamine-1-phosphate transferase